MEPNQRSSCFGVFSICNHTVELSYIAINMSLGFETPICDLGRHIGLTVMMLDKLHNECIPVRILLCRLVHQKTKLISHQMITITVRVYLKTCVGWLGHLRPF